MTEMSLYRQSNLHRMTVSMSRSALVEYTNRDSYYKKQHLLKNLLDVMIQNSWFEFIHRLIMSNLVGSL